MKSLIRMRQPVIQLQGNPDNQETYRYFRYNNPRKKVLCQKRKTLTTKRLPAVAKKYVETYFSSNAVAQNPEERVQMNISGKSDSFNFKY